MAKQFDEGISFSVSDKTAFAKEVEDFGHDGGAAVSAGIFDSDGKYSMETEFRCVLTSRVKYCSTEYCLKENLCPYKHVHMWNFNTVVSCTV